MENIKANSLAEKTEFNQGKDHISELPDEILIMILSRLGLMEAAKTSLLSKRWIYIWTRLPNLDLHPYDMFIQDKQDPELAYVHMVNQIVSSYQHSAALLKQFRVCYDLRDKYQTHITEWVKFAMSKQVNCLEVDLSRDRTWAYANPTLCLDVLDISSPGTGINFLISLSLTCVDVNDSWMELLLSNCHNLENLFLEYSRHLVTLIVGESCANLKCLWIRNCPAMKTLELKAKNLVSFEFLNFEGCNVSSYKGHEAIVQAKATKLFYNKLPSLTEASFGGVYSYALQVSDFQLISSLSSQLIKLSLNITQDVHCNLIKFPSFCNLEFLELTICNSLCLNLLAFTCFVDACPSLHALELRVHSMILPYKKETGPGWKLQAPHPINQFSLYFFELASADFSYITGWIKYALSRRVEKLLLHTVPCSWKNFALGCDVLEDCLYNVGLGFLKSLCLRNVNVSGVALELVLFNCHLLEELQVENSDDLVDLKVRDLSSLRYLAIFRCLNMKCLQICAPSLSCFEFSGPEAVDVTYNGLPSLIRAVFAGGYCNHQLLPKFKQISCFSSQLVKLSLNLVEVYHKHVDCPPFPNVKYLELFVMVQEHESLLPLASLAEACPMLHKLKLEVWWKCSCLNKKLDFYEGVKYATCGEEKQRLEIINGMPRFRLPNLKVFEWAEYSGLNHNQDMELAICIIKNAPKLTEFLCHATNPWCHFGWRENFFRALAVGRKVDYSDFLEYHFCRDKRNDYQPKPDNRKKPYDASRRRAQQLASFLPLGVDVCII